MRLKSILFLTIGNITNVIFLARPPTFTLGHHSCVMITFSSFKMPQLIVATSAAIRRQSARLWIYLICLPGLALAATPELSTTNTLLAGTRFATEWYLHDSGMPGPTIFIVGGVHGNEPAGAVSAEVIRQWSLAKGKLVIVPRANVPGLVAKKRLIPGLQTNLSNLNRNYPRAAKADDSPRGEPAVAIWNLALQSQPDWVLDLHEGFDFHQVNEKSVGSSIINFPNPKGVVAADLMLSAVNREISDEKLKFIRRDMPIEGSLARAAGEYLHVPAMTLETTSKQPLEKRVHQQEVLVHTLLKHLGMVNGEIPARPVFTDEIVFKPNVAPVAPEVVDHTTNTARLRVALYKGPGTGGAGPPNLMQRLNRAPDSSITEVSPEEIRAGALTNFHVVIFGGGSGSKEAEAIGEVGRSNVADFVANGGGYIGICAGAYLCTAGYPWSLKILNVKTVSPKWQRGRATLKLETTERGREILGTTATNLDVVYHNGPVVNDAGFETLPKFEPLAYFRTEVASNGTPVGVMVDSPAMLAGEFKNGRVIFISPHPEQTKGLEDIVPNAIFWAAKVPADKAAAPTKESKAE
jgi:predicted deacylase